MERDKSRMGLSLFAGRNVINYLLYTLCLRAERDQLLVVYSLFAGRNVMNHAPTADALPFANTKNKTLIDVNGSLLWLTPHCESIRIWAKSVYIICTILRKGLSLRPIST